LSFSSEVVKTSILSEIHETPSSTKASNEEKQTMVALLKECGETYVDHIQITSNEEVQNHDDKTKIFGYGQISTKIYDKRDDFNFKIINVPNMCSNIPVSPACGV
jgi:hypothetical protein